MLTFYHVPRDPLVQKSCVSSPNSSLPHYFYRFPRLTNAPLFLAASFTCVPLWPHCTHLPRQYPTMFLQVGVGDLELPELGPNESSVTLKVDV